MSIYRISPSPNFGTGEILYESWEDGFTAKECDKIIRYGESLNPHDSVVGQDEESHEVETTIRKSKNSWIELNDDTEWLYDRLGNILRCMNGMHWRFDIHGFHEHLQYTVYNDDDSFYRWHVDNMVLGEMPPIVTVFPSYVVHRVTPVTRGTRRSLVVWANGPGFR